MIPRHWKRAAADNGLSDPNVDVRPGRFASTVLGSIRGLMASGAASRDDVTGELVATLNGSTTNVYSVSSNEGLIDITTGINGIPAAITTPFLLRLSFGTPLAGSAANVPHLKVDGFDCGPILNNGGGAVADGDLTGRPVLVLGDMAAATDTKVTRVRVLDLLPSDIAVLAGGEAIGTIKFFAGLNTPSGFLVAAGQLLPRASYPKLWAHAQASGMITDEGTWQNNFGYQSFFTQGDGASTFRIPALNGLFLRALDSNRNLDPNRIAGTSQSDAFRTHTHSLSGGGLVIQLYGGGPTAYLSVGNPNNGYYAASIAAAGDSETRPYNAAYPLLIRAY